LKDIIVIVGPTGVGKTKLSVNLAKALDAEIINGDSVAIYRKLDIGSAKPTLEEREGIPHHLIDIRDVDEDYTVFDYQQDFRKVIEEISSRGKRVIIVGGTGLYIKAGLYDYKFTVGTTNKDYKEKTNLELVQAIKDYGILEIPDINNRRRLVRLLNKLENNEEITNGKDKFLYNIKVIGLTTERNVLYERINRRVDEMLDKGLLQEVVSLKEYFEESRILNSAIDYKEFYDYLFNKKELSEVIDEIKRNSRRFAKRQYTFFKNQFKVEWFSVNFENFNETVSEVIKYIEG